MTGIKPLKRRTLKIGDKIRLIAKEADCDLQLGVIYTIRNLDIDDWDKPNMRLYNTIVAWVEENSANGFSVEYDEYEIL